jgi:hypothetical protein
VARLLRSASRTRHPSHAGLTAVAALAALALLAGGLAACGSDKPRKAEPTVQTVAVPARGADRAPAAAAGGACQLLDFFAVEQLIGVQFEVAASAQRDTTATCVLQKSGTGYPDLTLAITPTTVAAAAFKASAVPPGAADLAGLGQAAYQLVRPAPAADPTSPGPAVEIGWLARNSQLMLVRFRLPADKPQSDADGMVPRVTELAKFLDPA